MPLQINPSKSTSVEDNKENVENTSKESTKSLAEEQKIEDNAPYTDERSVIISPVRNYSLYRSVNALALGTPKLVIGSSIHSTQVLSSRKDEVESYFPALLGLNPTHPDFMKRVKMWLSNIRFIVNENSALDITFYYDRYADYKSVKAKEEAINKMYDEADKSNLDKLENALKRKINDINDLEATKSKLGSPRNISHYLIYRHCLLYKDVAKDVALINTDPSIRFYIKDEQKEKEREEKLLQSRKTAMRNYIECLSSDKRFNSVYVQACVALSYNITEYSLKTRLEKEKILMDFANDRPDKFNKIIGDKNVETKAFIETLIARGELSRSEHNQNIYTSDGDFIAANIKEAVVYFNNPDNKDIRTVYENKLKVY